MTTRDRFFTIDHISASSFNASHELAEQAIHCLELVAELVEAGLSFQFKGGNSLLLILDTPQRFSIDVDIATDASAEAIEAVLSAIVEEYSVFTRWDKRSHKTKPWIPLSSYYLFYHSAVHAGTEANIMLDCQMHLSPYPCEKHPVVCGDIFTSATETLLPLPSSIIGDKLLTLGPSTLGIPVGKGKEAQRLKHFFDVARLLDMDPDLDAIRESFNKCLAFENDLQGRTLTVDMVVRDTLESAWSVVHFREPPPMDDDHSVLSEHVRGLAPFAQHLFRERYCWTDLQYDMAKAACCIAAVGAQHVASEEFSSVFSGGKPENELTGEEKYAMVKTYWNHVARWFEATSYSLPGDER